MDKVYRQEISSKGKATIATKPSKHYCFYAHNWDIKYCYLPLLWRAGDPCCGPVGQHLRNGPHEIKVCVRVCVRACVTVNHSRRPPIITLSEWAVGRNWRRGPQLSQGLVGGPQWLIDSSHAHKPIWADVPQGPLHDPDNLWTLRRAGVLKTQAKQKAHRRPQEVLSPQNKYQTNARPKQAAKLYRNTVWHKHSPSH